ncbi:sodium/solute symporter [Planctomycetota bacterium]
METAASFGTLNYCILFVYLAIVFGVGICFSGKQKTTKDYFLGGRKLPWFVVSMSLFVSLLSAISYMAYPAAAYKENIALIFVCFNFIIIAPFLCFLFYPFYSSLGVTTSYEYINYRFGQTARFVASTLFILARLGWLGVVIYAPALALSVVSGVNIYLAIFLMGGLAAIYTVLGGLAAVVWTDVLQFVFLVAGAIWVAISLINNVPDGLAGIIEIASQEGHLEIVDWKLDLFKMSGLAVMVSYFFQSLQDFGTDQVNVQRLMAVKDYRSIVKAICMNSLYGFFLIGLLLFIGLGIFAYFHHYPQFLREGIEGDQILPYYIMHGLPNGVSGIVITAIFAAAMSSMDSGINSLATVIINDIVKPLRKKIRTETQDVKLARILTLVLGVFAIGTACYASTIEEIFKAAATFIGIFSGPILALFLLGILSRRASFHGWIIGTAVAVPAMLWFQHGLKGHWIYYFPFCFGIALIVGYIASVIIGKPKAPSELTIWGRKNLKREDYSSD